jgi:hypothetical protein
MIANHNIPTNIPPVEKDSPLNLGTLRRLGVAALAAGAVFAPTPATAEAAPARDFTAHGSCYRGNDSFDELIPEALTSSDGLKGECIMPKNVGMKVTLKAREGVFSLKGQVDGMRDSGTETSLALEKRVRDKEGHTTWRVVADSGSGGPHLGSTGPAPDSPKQYEFGAVLKLSPQEQAEYRRLQHTKIRLRIAGYKDNFSVYKNLSKPQR